MQAYINPYTDHAGSSLDLRPIGELHDQILGSESTIIDTTGNPIDNQNLGSVDLTLVSSQNGCMSSNQNPISLADKSKQLL